MIGIVYLGSKVFADYTRSNHERLFNELRSNWPITVYDFSSTMIHTGPDYVKQFYHAADNLSERILIKLEKSQWITAAALPVIISECSMIADNQLDISYLGMELSEDYATDYARHAVDKTIKIQDAVVIANIDRCKPSNQALLKMSEDRKATSSNRAWRHLIDEHTRAVTVHTQLPMVIDDFLPQEDTPITTAYVNVYGQRTPAARTYWILKGSKA
jgi:hypothetical protein